MAVLLAVAWPASAPDAIVYLTQAQALERAFPGADRVERRSWLLTEEQASRITQLSRAPLDSRLLAAHTAWKDGHLLGHALIDVHTVRTLPEALMIVLDPAGRVGDVVMLAFHEPTDYKPAARWYTQFVGRGLDARLQLRADVDAISGATLSARAATRSVRRALAIGRVLLEEGPAVAEASAAE